MPGRLGLAILALAALAAPAHASTDDDARDAMARGVAALGTGDPARALIEFTLAIQLVPDAPVPYRYAGEALEQLGRWDEALARYDQYLRIRPDGRDADDVRARIARIRTEHLEGRVAIRCVPDGARVAIDGVEVGVTPLVGLRIGRGAHTVEVVASDHVPKRLSITVTPGTEVLVPCKLDRLPPRGPSTVAPARAVVRKVAPAPAKPWYRRPWVWAVAGAVVIGGGVATYVAWPSLPRTAGGDIGF